METLMKAHSLKVGDRGTLTVPPIGRWDTKQVIKGTLTGVQLYTLSFQADDGRVYQQQLHNHFASETAE